MTSRFIKSGGFGSCSHSKSDRFLVTVEATIEQRLNAEVVIQASAQKLSELKTLRGELMALQVLHNHPGTKEPCRQLSLSQLGSIAHSECGAQKRAKDSRGGACIFISQVTKQLISSADKLQGFSTAR